MGRSRRLSFQLHDLLLSSPATLRLPPRSVGAGPSWSNSSSVSKLSRMIAQSVLQACMNLGVREFVVCAGSRNSDLVHGLLQHRDQVQLYSFFEERSAAFFALGRTLAQPYPVAIITTSGTAAAELLPAVIEAHYQERPLVMITADRPIRYRGSGAPQAIERSELSSA